VKAPTFFVLSLEMIEFQEARFFESVETGPFAEAYLIFHRLSSGYHGITYFSLDRFHFIKIKVFGNIKMVFWVEVEHIRGRPFRSSHKNSVLIGYPAGVIEDKYGGLNTCDFTHGAREPENNQRKPREYMRRRRSSGADVRSLFVVMPLRWPEIALVLYYLLIEPIRH
jgi:hypothetical protein